MTHRIEIHPKKGCKNPLAEDTLAHIRELGIESIESVKTARLFFLFGSLEESQVESVARDLLADPVIEDCVTGTMPATGNLVEVHLQPGVMDPVAASVQDAVGELGLEITGARTGTRYELTGTPTPEETELIARSVLANTVIENIFYETYTPDEPLPESYKLEVIEVPVRDLDDESLEKLSAENDLFLNLVEMRTIRDYYRNLGREPSDIELETLAQTWSEHCVHKTFRSDVMVRDGNGNRIEEMPNLIKSTIFSATRQLDKKWCLNVFEDNSGVIEFDDDWGVCFKVETHNHPSAIEPYGGASTGIGGVIRDPLGTGLGARPVANTDVFCFGQTEVPLSDIPRGTLHPLRVMRGVVSGVRDYGNRMGIPTVNGAVYFDNRYIGNPLVFCGTAAIIPRDKSARRTPLPGDAIICVGGRTGRDGIHGATFSSGELTHSHEDEFSHAVQIGNPITEKKMLDVIIQARDEGLYSCITDCGAGGLSSAVGETAGTLGAKVHLEKVPLKYSGLKYDEIWISEAQERMVIAAPQKNVDRIMECFGAEDVEATVIGTYGCRDDNDRPVLKLFYQDQPVGCIDVEFLHEGLPRPRRNAVVDRNVRLSAEVPEKENYNDTLEKILSSPNVASKEWIIRQYDHEVQGTSVIKPLVGVNNDGPGDAAVIRPLLSSEKGLVLACGMNPVLGDLDPCQSALHAVDEAMRNLVSVGGNPGRAALLDNFCWGNCDRPEMMGSLVEAARACHHAALAYSVPFISGKDSLNNEFRTEDGKLISIPATLLISAIGVVDNAGACITSDAKSPGNAIYLLGRSGGGLGGSHLLKVENLETGNDVPEVDCDLNIKTMRAVYRAVTAGLIRSCHDLSEGGLAVAAAEMAFSGGCGMKLSISSLPANRQMSTAEKLFGEAAGRFLVEIEPEKKSKFTSILQGVPFVRIGEVNETGKLVIDNCISAEISALKKSWQSPGSRL